MNVLVTGGTGNTGRPLGALLRERGLRPRIATRHPAPGDDWVRFDWRDPATHGPALAGMDAVYLVPPLLEVDPMPLVGPFLAKAAGRKVVLLGSLAVLHTAPGLADLHDAVRELPGSVVLRPSGFMQNFTGAHPLADGIRERGEIVTAAGAGRLGWIDAADIAAVAAAALADDRSGEYVLTGPATLSYGEAAATITEVTGRPIRIMEVTVEEHARRNRTAGMPAAFAEGLAGMEAAIRAGSEDTVSSAVAELTGRPPRSFRDFALAELDAGSWRHV